MNILVDRSLLSLIFIYSLSWKQSGTVNTLRISFKMKYQMSSKDGFWEWDGTVSTQDKEWLSFEMIFKNIFKFINLILDS